VAEAGATSQDVLRLEHATLRAGGRALFASLSRGQMLGVMGPAGSGKSLLLRIIAGEAEPFSGALQVNGSVVSAAWPNPNRRATPRSMAQAGRTAGRAGSASRAAEALLATRLSEVAERPISELSPAQWAACGLLGALASRADLILIDELLDRLDPWAYASSLALLRERAAGGAGVVATTNRPETAAALDGLIVLDKHDVVFAGQVPDLLRSVVRSQVTVVSRDQPGVRAIAAPFEVEASVEGDTIRMEAAEGQELAARLLVEGYGDVSYVLHREPTVDEALRALIR